MSTVGEELQAALVILKDWIKWVDGKQYMGVLGSVVALSDNEAVGFRVRGGDTANWLLQVRGEWTTAYILGCQVRAVIELKPGWAGRMSVDQQTYLSL